MKNRMKCAIGCTADDPVADAFAASTAVVTPATPISGSPLVTVEAGAFATPDPEPSSRRDTANAAHAKGPTAGASPPRAPSQDNRLPSKPRTEPRGAAAVITGASATTGVADTAESTATDADGETPDPAESIPTAEWLVSCAARPGEPVAITARGVGSTAGTGTASADTSSTVISFTTGAELLRRLPAELATGPPGTPQRPARVDEAGPSDDEPFSEAAGLASDPEGPRPLLTGLVRGEELDDESEALEPAGPAEPVVSATATGITATAEPTTSANAKAPIRPTSEAVLDVADALITPRQRHSVARTPSAHCFVLIP